LFGARHFNFNFVDECLSFVELKFNAQKYSIDFITVFNSKHECNLVIVKMHVYSRRTRLNCASLFLYGARKNVIFFFFKGKKKKE